MSELSGVALPFSRIVDLIDEERAAHGPYVELKRTNSSRAVTEPEIAPAVRPARSRNQMPTKGARARSGSSAPARRASRPRPEPARDSKKWLSKLDLDLAKTLSVPTGEFILKHAKIGTANGLKEPQVFQHVASRLIAQGARLDLTPQDVERLLRRHGWRTVADRKAASSWKPEGYRRPGRGGSSGARGGFWAGIANERYVRPVSGGLPSLGKRT